MYARSMIVNKCVESTLHGWGSEETCLHQHTGTKGDRFKIMDCVNGILTLRLKRKFGLQKLKDEDTYAIVSCVVRGATLVLPRDVLKAALSPMTRQ